jgi:hypothetical protein
LVAWLESVGGDNIGYTIKISCNNAAIVPNEYHNTGARSGNASLFLLSSTNADSLCLGGS